MANGRSLKWETDSIYTEKQVARVLKRLRISVEGETDAVYTCYCPYHGNTDTPSFAVNKTEGLFICYNPACARTGNLMQLIKTVGKMDDISAKRLVLKSRSTDEDVVELLGTMVEPQESFPEYVHPFRPNYMAEIQRDFWRFAEPQLYMKGRSFEKQTLKDFEIGYDESVLVEKGDPKNGIPHKYLDMVCVPMHDPMGKVKVGAVRRSITGKVFRNTPKLPTSDTLFNLHRAKRTGSTVVIVEASFSVMRLHQCGYPNAAGVLMGHFSDKHASLLRKYFDTVVIMTDYDKKQFHENCPKCRRNNLTLCVGHNPGEELGLKIAESLGDLNIMWAHHGGATRFPPGVKDPDDMDDEMIRHCLRNTVSHFEYALDL